MAIACLGVGGWRTWLASAIADAVLAAELRDGNPSLMLLQYPANLLFREPLTLHLFGPSVKARANFNLD